MEGEIFRLGLRTELEIIARIAIAALAGGIIGLERRHGDHPAGIRTLTLVSMGAAIFTVVSIFGFDAFSQGGQFRDPARVAAQIATGVGFIGAGTILRSGGVVRGLTTATGIWVAAALGMAAGVGMYVLCVSGALFAVLILVLFPRRRDAFDGNGGPDEQPERNE